MEKLIEELVGKKEISLFAILCVFAPSFILIFVWNRQLIFELDFVKLLVLAICIGMALYLPNLILILISYPDDDEHNLCKMETGEEVTFIGICALAGGITCIEIVALICIKVYYPNISVKDFLDVAIIVYIVLFVLLNIGRTLIKIINGIKKLKEAIKRKLIKMKDKV